jgi:hypothetical protein
MITSEIETRQRWTRELEGHLQEACEAEAAGDRGQAAWLFKKALFYDAKLAGAAIAKVYIDAAGRVY